MKRGARICQVVRDEIVKLYTTGTLTNVIASKYNIADSTVRKFIKEVGITPNQGRIATTQDQKNKIFELHNIGWVHSKISTETGVSKGQISKILRSEFNVEKRKATGNKMSRPVSEEQKEVIPKEYQDGSDYYTLSIKYNCSIDTIMWIVRDAGIKPRRGWASYRVTRWTDRKGRNFIFKSRWELFYVQMLDKENKDWDYEDVTYEINGQTYTPDIFVKENEQTIKIVEIHGKADEPSLGRFEKFIRLYPELPYEIMGPAELADAGLIERWYHNHSQGKAMTAFIEKMGSLKEEVLKSRILNS